MAKIIQALKSLKVPLLLLIIPVIGVLIVLFLTKYGAGISPDSISYITTADSIKAGNGLNYLDSSGELQRLIHFPPLFSLILSVFGNPTTGARILNAILFGVFAIIAGWFIYKRTRLLGYAFVLQILIVFSNEFIDISTMVWSEMLFIVSVSIALFALVEYSFSNKSWLLLVAFILFSLSPLIRYIGFAFIPLVPAYLILMHRKKPSVKEIVRIIIFSTLMLVPFLGFYLYNQYIGTIESIRTIGYNSIPVDKLQAGANTILLWFLPYRLTTQYSSLILTIISFAIIFGLVELYKARSLIFAYLRIYPDVLICSIFIVLYLAGLLGSIAILDKYTPIDYRLLSPIFMPVMYLALKAILSIGGPKALNIQVALLIYLTLFSIYTGFETISYINTNGRPFANKQWAESETVHFVKNLPESTLVYTNSIEAVYFIGGHKNFHILPTKHYISGNIISGYEHNYKELSKSINSESRVVYFTSSFNRSWRYPPPKEVEELLGITPTSLLEDGIVY